MCSVGFVATTERLHHIVQIYTWRRQLDRGRVEVAHVSLMNQCDV